MLHLHHPAVTKHWLLLIVSHKPSLMKTFRTIEKQAHLLGLPMTDLFALSFVMSLAIVLGIVLNFMIPMSKYYFWGVILSAGAAYLLLKRLNRNKHPSRIFSFLSYRFLQPRQVAVKSDKLRIKRQIQSCY